MRGGFSPGLARFLLIVPAVWFVFLLGRSAPVFARPDQSGTIDLKAVKYGGLVEAVKAQRGKVVVVDVWGEF
jgi:hypothetical protein